MDSPSPARLCLSLSLLASTLLTAFDHGATRASPIAFDPSESHTVSTDKSEGRPRLQVQSKHTGWARVAAWSLDGRTLAVGSSDATVRLWDCDTGRLRAILRGHTNHVTDVGWSPDGRLLASGGNGEVRLWDGATGQGLQVIEGSLPFSKPFIWSPDGTMLVAGGVLWDRKSGRTHEVKVDNVEDVSAVAWSPDGRTLLLDTDDGVRLWDVKRRKVSGRLDEANDVGDGAVAWSPDGRVIAGAHGEYAASGERTVRVRLWDAESGRTRSLMDGRFQYLWRLAWSRDGRTLAATGSEGSKGKVLVWVDNRLKPASFEVSDRARALAWSPDGQELAAGGRIWDTKSESMRFAVDEKKSEALEALAWSPDGSRLAFADPDGSVLLWEKRSGEFQVTLQGQTGAIGSVAWSPDGMTLASGTSDGHTWLWDRGSGQVRAILEGHSGDVWTLRWSADSRMLACVDSSGTVRLWDAVSGREASVPALPKGARAPVAWHPDGRRLACGSSDGFVRLWDVSGNAPKAEFEWNTGPIRCLAWSPTGASLATGSDDGKAQILDLGSTTPRSSFTLPDVSFDPSTRTPGLQTPASAAADREKVTFLLENSKNPILSISWRSDGRAVDLVCFDLTVRAWDGVNVPDVTNLEDHGYVRALGTSPDGETIAIATQILGDVDSVVRVWNRKTGRILASEALPVNGVDFSRDGKLVATADQSGTVSIWQIDELLARGGASGSGAPLCRLVPFGVSSDYSWLAVGADGRFDTNDLAEARHAHWVLPDDRLRTLPIEIFSRQYFEPGLLRKLIDGEQLPPLASVATLNPIQPLVRVLDVSPMPDAADRVRVRVAVAPGEGTARRGGIDVTLRTGCRDLRLFRDGQLVDALDGSVVGQMAHVTGSGPSSDGPFTATFDNIQLPAHAIQAPVEFSAYGFNDDDVKSPTDRFVYKPESPPPPRSGTTYVIAFGVNRFSSEDWNLRYASADARQALAAIVGRAPNAGVVPIALVSDAVMHEGEAPATRDNLRAVMDLLAGRPVADGVRDAIPNAARVLKAVPEDRVVFLISTHGYLGDGAIGVSGEYYLAPTDIGAASGRTVTTVGLRHWISSAELAAWLLHIDAIEIAIVLDACHSGGVTGESFKPGPMNSRGLGQLAFDKGMRILAASQAANVALEYDTLQNGILSYALVKEGIEAGEADASGDGSIGLQEWLRFGERRVPVLHEQIQRGLRGESVQFAKGVTIIAASGEADRRRKRHFQHPTLFDFARRRADVELMRVPAK
jgi:WD40 repeat protein